MPLTFDRDWGYDFFMTCVLAYSLTLVKKVLRGGLQALTAGDRLRLKEKRWKPLEALRGFHGVEVGDKTY